MVVTTASEPTAAPVGARLRLGRLAALAAGAASRRLRGGSGAVVSGRILQLVAPDAVSRLSVGREVTLVSGTNGKTSITALTVAALSDAGPVGTNAHGANTAVGVAGTVAATEARRLVLEIDEGWLPWAIRETDPTTVVLANLSRDQLSRHHEVGALAARWRSALAGVPVVVANADDPQVVWPALAARRQVWVAAGSSWVADSTVCPACGDRCVRFEGGWGCLACDLRRPQPDYWIEGDELVTADGRVALEVDLPGRVNLGNAAIALAAARSVAGGPLDAVARRLGSVHSVAGRYQRLRFRGHDLRILLAKNPAGWQELLEMMGRDRYPVVLRFNAEGVDGRDPSWLYDVSFAALRDRPVVVQGRRATDLLVRLELEGVAARHVRGSVADAIWELPAGRVDVVGNYTAFQDVLREVRHG